MNTEFQIVGVNSSKVPEARHRNNLLPLLGGKIEERLVDPENISPSACMTLIVLEPRRGRGKMRFRLFCADGRTLDQGSVESIAQCSQHQRVITVSGKQLFGYEFRVLAK